MYHREGGPAVIRVDGTQEWWLNGERHREDGPAAIYADGSQKWYINGKRRRDNSLPYILNTMTPANGEAVPMTDDDYEKYKYINHTSSLLVEPAYSL